jgi:hypothetical protein
MIRTMLFVSLLIMALGVGLFIKALEAPTQAQTAPPVQLAPDPDAQLLADAMQGLASAVAIQRTAILAYDKKIVQVIAELRAQQTWWQACAADKTCWEWVKP